MTLIALDVISNFRNAQMPLLSKVALWNAYYC